MKRLVLLLSMTCVLTLVGCSKRDWEELRNDYAIYENPRTNGGKFTIIQNGEKIEGCKCIYWSTNDDDSIFIKNGKKIWVNGTSIIIEE